MSSPAQTLLPSLSASGGASSLLFVAGLFALLLNYPLLGAFNRDGRVAGVPVLYLYILLAWLALILLTARLVRRNNR
ncbi:MAG: hypothetical protein WKG07_16980 [Hymenobacter sp.]